MAQHFATSSSANGNPLLRYLPALHEDDSDLAAYLTRRPHFDARDRQRSKSYRLSQLDTLEETFCPRPEYLRFCRAFERLLIAGYRYRGGLAEGFQRHRYLDNQPDIAPRVRHFISNGSCLLLAGITGAGKSYLVKLITVYFGGVIDHTKLTGGKIDLIQVPVLYMRCPPSSGHRAFCIAFFEALDATLDAHGLHSDLISKTKISLDALKSAVKQLCKTYAIGALILDEFQDMLTSARSRNRDGDRLTTNFLLWLRDEVRVPIAYVGTFPMLDFFDLDSRSARRSARGGAYIVDRFKKDSDEIWIQMCRAYWDSQWVRNPRPLGALHKILYKLSQGVPDFLHLLIKASQELAIESGQEYLNADLIQEAYDTRRVELHASVAALASGDRKGLRPFRDLWHEWADTLSNNSAK